MKKILNVNNGENWFEAYKDEKDTNPYKVYSLTWVTSKYGYPTKSKNLIAKYADFKSVLYHLAQIAQ